MCWLTPGEWRLLFALSFAFEIAGEIPATVSIDVAMLAVAKALSAEHKIEWSGLEIDDEGIPWPKQVEPVSPANLLWMEMLTGTTETKPDYERHIVYALGECQRRGELADYQPILEEALDEARAGIAKVRGIELSEADKEAFRDRMRLRQASLTALMRAEIAEAN